MKGDSSCVGGRAAFACFAQQRVVRDKGQGQARDPGLEAGVTSNAGRTPPLNYEYNYLGTWVLFFWGTPANWHVRASCYGVSDGVCACVDVIILPEILTN